jgi:hypothetical protein
MIRLIVHGLGGEGYLNFIGNEFGEKLEPILRSLVMYNATSSLVRFEMKKNSSTPEKSFSLLHTTLAL